MHGLVPSEVLLFLTSLLPLLVTGIVAPGNAVNVDVVDTVVVVVVAVAL